MLHILTKNLMKQCTDRWNIIILTRIEAFMSTVHYTIRKQTIDNYNNLALVRQSWAVNIDQLSSFMGKTLTEEVRHK